MNSILNIKDDIKSAFIHKNIVKKIYNSDFSNKSTLSIVYEIEEYIKNECVEEINSGIAFPVNVCLNECIAHNTPLDHNTIVKNGDLLKIDFGVHINGHITDCAFTIPINTNKFDTLINISKRATQIGVEKSGPDVLLSEIGESIEEYILSKEVEINGILYPVKNIKDLCGHSIAPYIVHSGKAVPNCKLDFNYPLRMVIGEKYAIEPFVTTGSGVCIYDNEHNNHFMLKPNCYYEYAKNKKFLNKSQNELYHKINAYYKSLPFTQRWLSEKNEYKELQNQCIEDLNILHKYDIVEKYPPIYDVKGSYVAHHEHNIIINDKGKLWLTQNKFF
jgi:methionyl aminopeptidase